jgi:hypothetical protein
MKKELIEGKQSKIAFYEKHLGPLPPHTRIGFLIYSPFLDWAFYPRIKHLFWRFWWREFELSVVRDWVVN